MQLHALLKTIATIAICLGISIYAQWSPTTLGSLVNQQRAHNRLVECQGANADGSGNALANTPIYACMDLGGKTPAAYQLDLCKKSMSIRREDSILPNTCMSPVNGFTVPSPMPKTAVYSGAGLKAWAGCKAAIMAMNERSPWPMEQCESLVNWPQIESAHKLQEQGYGGADLLTCDTKHVCS